MKKRKMKIKYLFFILVQFLITTQLFSQKSEGEFIIIHFEEKLKKCIDCKKSFYWIISLDDLKQNKNNYSRFFLSNFSKDNLENSCKGIAIDPLLVFPDSNYDFSSQYYDFIHETKKKLRKKRKKIQSIIIKWTDGQRKKINVYIIPVSGQFCITEYHPIGKERDDYHGNIVLPFSDIKFSKDISNELDSYIKLLDFTSFNYDIIHQYE